MIRLALLVLAGVLALAQPVLAHPGEQGAPEDGASEVLAPPPTYKAAKVEVDEQLGARVPVDAWFRTQDGTLVTLGSVLASSTGEADLPTILTFNYSDCPMLCSLQLNGLANVLPQIAQKQDGAVMRLGSQYRIVTIDLEPNEKLEKVARMREKYIARLPADQQDAARKGWTFLVAAMPGDGASPAAMSGVSIRRVADSVGFTYTYLPERAEYAHPAALIFLSVKGTVTRYVYGIEFDPQIMRDSIFKAGASEPASAIGFMNRCYHFDPDANNHSRAGVLALRVGAAGFVVLLLSGLGVMHVIRKNRPLHPKGNRV